MILTIIFLAGGFVAILYSVLALLSMMRYSRAQKVLPEKFTPEAGKPATVGPPIVEAYCQRARILLKSQRFEAALADCKRAIDINPKHLEANTLWKHALDREIPPDIVEPAVEPVPVPAEVEPPAKKVKKVVRKIKRRKKVVVPPPPPEKPVEEPAEEPTIVLEEAPPEIEISLEEKEAAAPPPPEPEEAAEIVIEPEVVPEEAPAEPEIELEAEPEAAEPTLELEAEAEVEPVAETEAAEVAIPEEEEAAEEPLPAEEITLEEEPAAEIEAPTVELEAEAEIEPAVEPEITETAEQEVPVARKPLPGEEEGPLIPEDKLVATKPAGESLLEEFDHDKLREFEEGEAGAGDAEWTRYADKKEPQLAKSKIDMNDLPAAATGLKETLTDLRQAEAFNLQGETNISKNLYNNAIKDFSRAIEINPNYVDALINRGSAYAKLGRFNDALMDFNHALKFEKKDAELFNKRGEIYLQNNMFDQAIKDFTSAVVLNPMFSDAYLNRGRAYSEKGMPEEAMTDFNQAIKADSDHSFTFVDRAAPGLHVDDDTGSNKEEADKLNQQGLSELKSGKHQEAAELFTNAINLSPNDAEGYINRGRAYLKLGKTNEAMADFNQAVLFDPLNPTLYFWRAQAWKAKDDKFNMAEDLKLSCEMGHEPACLEYRKFKTAKK